MIEKAADAVAVDNVELACAFVQKTAMEKAVPEMDKRLGEVEKFCCCFVLFFLFVCLSVCLSYCSSVLSVCLCLSVVVCLSLFACLFMRACMCNVYIVIGV